MVFTSGMSTTTSIRRVTSLVTQAGQWGQQHNRYMARLCLLTFALAVSGFRPVPPDWPAPHYQSHSAAPKPVWAPGLVQIWSAQVLGRRSKCSRYFPPHLPGDYQRPLCSLREPVTRMKARLKTSVARWMFEPNKKRSKIDATLFVKVIKKLLYRPIGKRSRDKQKGKTRLACLLAFVSTIMVCFNTTQ